MFTVFLSCKSIMFNCFWVNKSEPYLIYDFVFTVFLSCLPNRFCFNSEPRELVWESVWPIPPRHVVRKFKICFKDFKMWNLIFIFFRFQTQENRFSGLGTFCMFFKSKKSLICLPHGQFSINSLRCSTKVFRMNLPIDMALALF